MTLTPEKRDKFLYHARMFGFAVVGAVALFLMLMGGIFLMLWLGIWHIEDR
jgi:hypothetical protein